MGYDCGSFVDHFPALPNGGMIFGYIQRALIHTSNRLRLTPGSHSVLTNWHNLVSDLDTLPTHLLEVALLPPKWRDIH